MAPITQAKSQNFAKYWGARGIFRKQLSSKSSNPMLRIAVIILLLFTIFKFSISNKAVLLFPKNSVFQFTIGISVPLMSNERGSIVSSFGYQFNYALPWNVTQFQEDSIIPARENHNYSHKSAYTTIENFLNTYGWRDGRECLLRSICELAEIPLGNTDKDIFAAIIHLFLTPTEDLLGTVNASYQNIDKLYHEAETLGKSGGDCVLMYSGCIESPLEAFTKIVVSPF